MTAKSERQDHIEKWKASGQTKKAYSQSAGIKYATFIYWFRGEMKNGKEPGRFIKLGDEPLSSGLEVKFPNGVRLYLRGPLSIDLLKMLGDV